MARVATNKTLQQARKAKSDEFYTRLADIEKELNQDRPDASLYHRAQATGFDRGQRCARWQRSGQSPHD